MITHPRPDLSDPYFVEALAGLNAALPDWTLKINPVNTDVDAWVLLAPDGPQIDAALAFDKPAAIVNGASELLPAVDGDNIASAETVTAHLLELGHRRIGFIAGKREMANARDREEGFRRALSRAGLLWDPALVQEGRFDRALGRAAMERFLALAEPPTAVFACNDHSALGALDALRDRSRLIAVAGFDDIPEAALADLTTVRQPVGPMARLAGEWVRDWRRTGRVPARGVARKAGTLILRGSTVRCPQRTARPAEGER